MENPKKDEDLVLILDHPVNERTIKRYQFGSQKFELINDQAWVAPVAQLSDDQTMFLIITPNRSKHDVLGMIQAETKTDFNRHTVSITKWGQSYATTAGIQKISQILGINGIPKVAHYIDGLLEQELVHWEKFIPTTV